jgi:hypothetical protein
MFVSNIPLVPGSNPGGENLKFLGILIQKLNNQGRIYMRFRCIE